MSTPPPEAGLEPPRPSDATPERGARKAPALPYGNPFLIGDPAAGRRGLTELRVALAHAGVRADAAIARPLARAAAVAQAALASGARLLVAVGGDELAHRLVETLVGPEGPRHPDAVLGLVGLGRQDLAATFGLPDDAEQAAVHLLGDGVFEADAGRVRWRDPTGLERSGVFANCAELGYPALLSSRGPRLARAGRAGRFAAAVSALASARSTPVHLTVDHTAVDFRLAGLVLANGQFSMGRMRVAPRALPDDGRLAVIAFEGEPLAIYARSAQVTAGAHIPHPSVREYQTRTVRVETAEPMPLALDGNPVPGGPPLVVDLLPKALRIKI